jgi:hypothetical protein
MQFLKITMAGQLLFLAIIFSVSCGTTEKTQNTENKTTPEVTEPITEDKTMNALIFINSYVENCNKMDKSINVVDWVNSNELATTSFKTELKKIMDEAYKTDPEMGLGADPIFDAQDYPEKGYELESLDDKNNYLVVKGKDWPEFRLTMKVIKENENWLVDGCGIVNIPADKKIKR